MKNIWTILKRELGAYFNSAIAYIYLIVFIVINNGLFMTRFFLLGRADMRPYFDMIPTSLFIFIPVVAMRLWAADKKENTFELLMTFPMKPFEVVLGKFFASFVFYLITLATTLVIPLILFMSGSPDWGAIAGGYLGSILLGALFLAIGIFISGLTAEQIVAFVLTTVSCFLIFFLGTDFLASFLDGWIPGFGTFLKNNLGAASHIRSFGRGVVDIRDIVYFASMSFVFLLLNSFFFEGRLRPRSRMVFGSAVLTCLVGALALNWLVHDLPIGRFDMTEGKIYTVSPASKKILDQLKVPVVVKLYITPAEKMPTAFKMLEQEIIGKLEELKIVSDKKFQYIVTHAEASKLTSPDSDQGGKPLENSTEKMLQEKGIMPYQVESIDKDEVGLKLIYSAVTISYKEKADEILPRIVPQSLADLEYLLFSRILKLTREKKPKIALFSPLKAQELTFDETRLLSTMGQVKPQQYEDEYKTIVPLMRNNGYDVSRIALTKDDPIPDDLNTLLVVNPGPLTDEQVDSLEKFMNAGGVALIAAQGFDYAFQTAPPEGIQVIPQKLNLDINKLIQRWGVKVTEEMLMDENSQVINIVTGQSVGPFALSMPLKIPNQIVIKDNTMAKNMAWMNRLPSLFYMWGSALEISDDTLKQSGLKKTLMFTSGPKSWKAPFEGVLKKESLIFPKTGSEGKFPLAVMLEGNFSKTAAKPGKLIIAGCSKMFSDQVISNTGNLSLFANIVDGLTLGDDIIQIRAKTPMSRELKALSDTQKIMFRFLATLAVPFVLVVYAAIRFFLRRKEKQFYLLARG